MLLGSVSGLPPAVLPRWFYATDAPRPHSGQAYSVPQNKATGATTKATTTKSTASSPSSSPPPTTNLFSPSATTATAAAAAAAAAAVAANVTESSAQAAAAAAASAAAPSPVADKQPRPTNWEPFADEDSRELEAAYQQSMAARADARSEDRSPLVAVQEDQLFEVDIRARLLRPVYWRGNAYEVRRALWFQLVGNKYEPCEENLARQIEDGYLKHRPWLQEMDPNASGTILRATTAPVQSNLSTSPPPSMKTSSTAPFLGGNTHVPGNNTTGSNGNNTTSVSKWPLLGPYITQSVLFTSARGAWLLSGNFAETIVAKFTKGENLGGIKLVRGWDEVERLTQKNDKIKRDKLTRASPSTSSENDTPLNKSSNELDDYSLSSMDIMDDRTNIDSSGSKSDKSSLARQNRKIEHLILVVHGIGQKLGEKTDLVNIVNDCNVLRQVMKDPTTTAASYNGTNQKKTPNDPDLILGRGVQVLPVEWRYKIQFGAGGEHPLGDGMFGGINNNTSEEEEDSEENSEEENNNLLTENVNKEEESSDGDLFGGSVAHGKSIEEERRRKRRSQRRLLAAQNRGYASLPSLLSITLDGIPAIRTLVSDVLLDVLLYMTPKYRRQMYDALIEELNRIYRLFIRRNPNFLLNGGCISILGHSLGSVISFDVLCAQRSRAEAWMSLRGHASQRSKSAHNKKSSIADSVARARSSRTALPPLEFPVSNLFALGSPIGLFLLLKGCVLRPRGPNGCIHYAYEAYGSSAGEGAGLNTRLGPDGLPHMQLAQPLVENLYNVYHRADPIAYRMEPLVDPGRASTAPKPVPYTKGGLRGLHLGMQEVGSGIAGRASTMFATMCTSIRAVSIFKSLSKEVKEAKDQTDDADVTTSSANQAQNARFSMPTDPRVLLEQLNYSGRVDWCLQEGVLENEYLTGLQVHFNYWSDVDIAAFLLRECARD